MRPFASSRSSCISMAAPKQASKSAGGFVSDLRGQEESVPLDWAAVGAYLARNGMRLDADPPPRQFAGGLANLNYLIHLDGKPAVLRRPPMGELPAGA